jgi:hypothetical protein
MPPEGLELVRILWLDLNKETNGLRVYEKKLLRKIFSWRKE